VLVSDGQPTRGSLGLDLENAFSRISFDRDLPVYALAVRPGAHSAENLLRNLSHFQRGDVFSVSGEDPTASVESLLSSIRVPVLPSLRSEVLGPDVELANANPQTLLQGGEAVVLAGKTSTRVDSALVVKGASPTRSDESIRKALKGLDAWLKFQYHKAQRDRPSLGAGLTIEFTITPQGDVVNCRVASSTLGYPPLEETISKRFCLLTFPPLDEGADDEVTTKYFIDFEGFR